MVSRLELGAGVRNFAGPSISDEFWFINIPSPRYHAPPGYQQISVRVGVAQAQPIHGIGVSTENFETASGIREKWRLAGHVGPRGPCLRVRGQLTRVEWRKEKMPG
jgi:hypothetical protein